MVLTNAGGGGVLAADACAVAGLHLQPPSSTLRAILGHSLPATASLGNPIDTTAAVPAATFARCLRAAMDDVEVDAVVVITVPTALGDPSADIAQAVAKARAGGRETPVVAVDLTQRENLRLLGDTVPSFAEPAVAVSALAHAAHYGQWLRRSPGRVPALPDIDVTAARALVDSFLTEHSDGWLPAPEVTKLLRCFGIPVLDIIPAIDEDDAVAAFRTLGGPVALKAVAQGLLHKSAGGGVALDIADEPSLRVQARLMRDRFGADLLGYLVQPMASPGRELLVGVVGDASFGPLVVFGLGGTDTDVIDKRVTCLVPVTDTDSHDLLQSFPAPKALAGIDVGAVRTPCSGSAAWPSYCPRSSRWTSIRSSRTRPAASSPTPGSCSAPSHGPTLPCARCGRNRHRSSVTSTRSESVSRSRGDQRRREVDEPIPPGTRPGRGHRGPQRRTRLPALVRTWLCDQGIGPGHTHGCQRSQGLFRTTASRSHRPPSPQVTPAPNSAATMSTRAYTMW